MRLVQVIYVMCTTAINYCSGTINIDIDTWLLKILKLSSFGSPEVKKQNKKKHSNANQDEVHCLNNYWHWPKIREKQDSVLLGIMYQIISAWCHHCHESNLS